MDERLVTVMNLMPIQSPPVKRPEIIPAWSAVNFTHGTLEALISVYMHLTHGANYDDPSPWMSDSFMQRKSSR